MFLNSFVAAPLYQFIWDNVGKEAKARFQATHRNANHLWALIAAVGNRHDFWDLDDRPTRYARVNQLQELQ